MSDAKRIETIVGASGSQCIESNIEKKASAIQLCCLNFQKKQPKVSSLAS
jgi:hypothetical protein